MLSSPVPMSSYSTNLIGSAPLDCAPDSGGDDVSPSPDSDCMSEFSRYFPQMAGWSAAGSPTASEDFLLTAGNRCEKKLSGGCFRLNPDQEESPASELEPSRPRYLWVNIPPRLEPDRPSVGSDLFDLDCDAGEEEDPWSPEEFGSGVGFWGGKPSERVNEDAAVSTPCAPDVHDDGECCASLTLPASSASVRQTQAPGSASVQHVQQRQPPGAEANWRPLHHCGGGLQESSPERVSHIAIDLPPEPHGPACPGRIKLEISAPCSSTVTVSVGTCHVPTGSSCPVPPAVSLLPPVQSRCTPAVAPEDPQDDLQDDPEDEPHQLTRVTAYLRDSHWYYGAITWQEARLYLEHTAEGTYLARDSFDPRFLFALTVQTGQGPTSVRVHFNCGRFMLDCPDHIRTTMPSFRDVNSLVHYYSNNTHMVMDHKGRPLLKVRLLRPLLRQVPSLQHWCRLSINALRLDKDISHLLPAPLAQYVNEYPFAR